VGEVVGPFHSQFGWHLLEVLGHEVRSLDESRYGQRVDAAFQDWLLQMRSQSEIKVDGRWADLVSPSG
jgi:parvulin-like peptidyl-prolyl isomerase